jgi:penicillin-binding protein 2
MDGERLLRRRFFILTVIFAGSIGLLVLYLFYLQIIRGVEYSQKARDVSQRETPILAQRGEIFDRNNEPLVFNIDSFAVDVIPGEVKTAEIPALFARLSQILSVPIADIEKRVPPKNYKLFQPIEVKGGVSLQTIAYLAEHIDGLPGVSWHNKPIRSYVQEGSLAHVIGYVGDITRDELQVLYNKGYAADSVLGKSGIEKQYEDVLRGKDGQSYRVVDVREQSQSGEGGIVVPPVAGRDIVLTIDTRIQKVAEQALGPRKGSVVVLKPATGEILALVSYPTFDPNKFFSPDASQYLTKLSLDPSSPFLDRAIQSVYPPASVFKIVMTTGVIDDATIPIGKMVFCPGKLEFGDRVFNCWVRTGHGYVDLFGGLAQSCDVYFYTVGNELGVEKIDSYARDFGIGALSGIDLPEERAGLLPTPEWKEKTQHLKWVGGDTLNLSIGQGFITLSPLQMADMVALIANHGVIYKPHVLKETRDPVSGKTIFEVKPEVSHASPISKDTFQMVQDAMRGVITKGTAASVIDTKAVEIAGKTGTSEVGIPNEWHSWFAAYAPYKTDRPEDMVVVVVMVEASENWEWWAPKAANIIFQCIFAHQSYEEAVATLKPWYIQVKGREE